jgi:hypothetical protein
MAEPDLGNLSTPDPDMNTPLNSLINSPENSLINSKYRKSEPFLWFHVALLAAVPLTLILGMLGLGVGDPVLPEWFEITVLGLPAIALPIGLQWWKPLSPFSLWLFAKPLELTDDNERRILAVVKDFKTVLVAIALGVVIDAIFYKMYSAAPIVANALPLPDGLRILGMIWWLGFFLISNFLIQAGAVAIRVLLLSESDLNQLTPLPLENINSTFTSLGKRSPDLLNFIPDSSPEIISEAILEPKVKDIPKVKPEELPKSEDAPAPEAPKSEPVVAEVPTELISIPEPILEEIPEPVIEKILSADPESPVPESLVTEPEESSIPVQTVAEEIIIKTEVVEAEVPPEEPPEILEAEKVIPKPETTISAIASAWESPVIPTSESD